MFLVDTNVLSETTRRAPNARVVEWLEAQAIVGVPTIVLQELAYGVECAPQSKQRFLRSWLELLLGSEAFTLVPFEQQAALETGRLLARCRQRGRGITREDAQIAGTALAHSAILVTRNTAHFEGLRVPLINPFA